MFFINILFFLIKFLIQMLNYQGLKKMFHIINFFLQDMNTMIQLLMVTILLELPLISTCFWILILFMVLFLFLLLHLILLFISLIKLNVILNKFKLFILFFFLIKLFFISILDIIHQIPIQE